MHHKSGLIPFPEFGFKALGDFGTLIGKVLRKSLPINQEVISRLLDEYQFSADKFYQKYKTKPLYSLEQGMKETVEWFLSK